MYLFSLLVLFYFAIQAQTHLSEVDQALLKAVATNNIECVREALNADAHIDVHGDHGDTALHRAAFYGYDAIIKLLLTSGATPNVRNNFSGETALALAAMHGHISTLLLLLNADIPINSQNKRGKTALHWAAINGHANVIEMLLIAGAQINILDEEKLTPLYWATLGGHIDAVQLLLAAGAEIDIYNKSGITAFHWAAINGYIVIADLMFDAGALITSDTWQELKDKIPHIAYQVVTQLFTSDTEYQTLSHDELLKKINILQAAKRQRFMHVQKVHRRHMPNP